MFYVMMDTLSGAPCTDQHNKKILCRNPSNCLSIGLLGGHREWLQIFDIKTMLTLLTGAKSRSFLLNTSTAVSSASTTFLHSIHLHSYLLRLYGLPPLNAPPAAQLRLI